MPGFYDRTQVVRSRDLGFFLRRGRSVPGTSIGCRQAGAFCGFGARDSGASFDRSHWDSPSTSGRKTTSYPGSRSRDTLTFVRCRPYNDGQEGGRITNPGRLVQASRSSVDPAKRNPTRCGKSGSRLDFCAGSGRVLEIPQSSPDLFRF